MECMRYIHVMGEASGLKKPTMFLEQPEKQYGTEIVIIIIDVTLLK